MAARFEIHKGSGNQRYWWTLLGNNNETLCTSETYSSKASARNGIDAVKRVAGTAPVTDLTGESSSSAYSFGR